MLGDCFVDAEEVDDDDVVEAFLVVGFSNLFPFHSKSGLALSLDHSFSLRSNRSSRLHLFLEFKYLLDVCDEEGSCSVTGALDEKATDGQRRRNVHKFSVILLARRRAV